MKSIITLFGFVFLYSSLLHAECFFQKLVDQVKGPYLQKHQIYPIPEKLKELAIQYQPKLWVHPDSWLPISFDDYLKQAKLFDINTDEIIDDNPTVTSLKKFSPEQECEHYLKAPDIAPPSITPIYVQIFQDHSPTGKAEQWTYIKYNLMFDWSGLAEERSLWASLGAWLAGGNTTKWHRLDIHTAAILSFDEQMELQFLTLSQHNHEQTYIRGVDFDESLPIHLNSAVSSNELYLDGGETTPQYHRVVPFFTEVGYLIDQERAPFLWAKDITYGRNAGAKSVELTPVFLEPEHPLADFSGLLAPPDRLMGIYIGRDGPPGFNYYAHPDFYALPDFVALGYWESGDLQLADQLEPMMDGLENTDWKAIVDLMRTRLEKDTRVNFIFWHE